MCATMRVNPPISPFEDGLPHGLIGGNPAARMVHGHLGAVGLDGLDDPIGVLDRCGQRLLTDDAADTCVRGVADRIGVQVIRRRHRDNIQTFLLEHLMVVSVLLDAARGDFRPLIKAWEYIGIQVADSHQFVFRRACIGIAVGTTQSAANDGRAQLFFRHGNSLSCCVLMCRRGCPLALAFGRLAAIGVEDGLPLSPDNLHVRFQ